MKRNRIIATVCACAVCLGLLITGVIAAVRPAFNMSGKMAFDPKGVFCDISGEVYRGESYTELVRLTDDPTYTMDTVQTYILGEEGNIIEQSEGTPSWSPADVPFLPAERLIQYRISFANKGTTNISVIPSEISSLPANVTATEESSATLLIEPGKTEEFRLLLTLAAGATTFSSTQISMSFDIQETSSIENPASDFTMNSTTTTQLDSINSNYNNDKYGQRVVVVPTSLGAKSTITGSSSSPAFKNLTTSTKYLILPNGLNALEDYSMYRNAGLIGVGIPSDLTSIGYFAFSVCKSLTSITIPNGVTSIEGSAFSNCTSLTSVAIPSGVTSIGNDAFKNSTSLASIIIPNSVTNISSSAFDGCKSLTSITIPSGVTSISSTAFNDCTSLVSITIPSGVTSIGGKAFSGCKSLTSITIPSGVTSIADSAFSNCTSLTSVAIPSSVTSIGDSVFAGAPFLDNLGDANGLKIVTSSDNLNYKFLLGYTANIKADITSDMLRGVRIIAYYAFSSCKSLTSITIPSGVTSISYCAFSGCTSLTSITTPSSVTNIGYRAFSGCTSLASITIPNSVTSIDRYAFSDCTSLASITIPSGVTSIENNAFSGCTSLTSINIPNSVTSISGYAFSGCTSLNSIYMEGSAPEIYSNSFGYSSSAPYTNSGFKIYVKSANLSSYQPTSGYSTSGRSTNNWYYYNSNGKIATY